MRELLELVASDTEDREAHLKLVFEWYEARATTFVRSTLAAAAAVPAAFILGTLKADATVDDAAVIVGGLATGLLAIAALWQNHHLSHLHREYLTCVRLLHELEDFRDELRSYLRATGGALR
jgi:hypothetical protein